jgi:hypothetical protein
MRLLIAAWAGVILVIGSMGAAVAASPNIQLFHAAPLKARNEVQTPPVESHATGAALFRLDHDAESLSYRLLVGNIDGVAQAHIHVGAEGQNGPVVAFLFGPEPPGGRVFGTLARGEITAADLIGPLAGQPLSALVDEIESGNAYVNVHTDDYPMGEIRAQME